MNFKTFQKGANKIIATAFITFEKNELKEGDVILFVKIDEQILHLYIHSFRSVYTLYSNYLNIFNILYIYILLIILYQKKKKLNKEKEKLEKGELEEKKYEKCR